MTKYLFAWDLTQTYFDAGYFDAWLFYSPYCNNNNNNNNNNDDDDDDDDDNNNFSAVSQHDNTENECEKGVSETNACKGQSFSGNFAAEISQKPQTETNYVGFLVGNCWPADRLIH